MCTFRKNESPSELNCPGGIPLDSCRPILRWLLVRYDLDFTSRSNFLAAFLHDHAHKYIGILTFPAKKSVVRWKAGFALELNLAHAWDLVDEALPLVLSELVQRRIRRAAWEKNSDSSSPGFDDIEQP